MKYFLVGGALVSGGLAAYCYRSPGLIILFGLVSAIFVSFLVSHLESR